jgi:hypothetical protein
MSYLIMAIHLRSTGLLVGSGAAGDIAKVTHVLQVFARFSVLRSLYPLRLRYPW